MEYQRCTTKSDVGNSYMGGAPYPGSTNAEVVDKVLAGYHVPSQKNKFS